MEVCVSILWQEILQRNLMHYFNHEIGTFYTVMRHYIWVLPHITALTTNVWNETSQPIK